MGFFDLFLKNRPAPKGKFQGKFQMLNGYEPRFTTWGGSLYESELIRSAINARAVHISKLKFETEGSAKPALQNKLQKGPNQFQTWSQFLYRLSTVLDVHNTAFIIPIYDKFGEISGIFCPLPASCEVVQYGDVPYLRYEFRWGEKAAIELEYCGILTKFQYRNDLMGENNHALYPTMDLIHIQNQGIQEAVKSSATYRFYAQVNNFSKTADLANERKRFTEENFSKEAEGGGLLLFPNTYTNINQVKSEPYTVAASEMALIEKNVYQYFMVNEDILQSKAFGDSWSAFYESVVESFAIQFSEVMTRMLFTFREQSQGNLVMLTANRLQYMSNADKLNVSSQLLDRGVMSINDIREIWNLPPVDGGDARIIRGEYWNADEKINEERIDNEE
jgi:hypothetical protein